MFFFSNIQFILLQNSFQHRYLLKMFLYLFLQFLVLSLLLLISQPHCLLCSYYLRLIYKLHILYPSLKLVTSILILIYCFHLICYYQAFILQLFLRFYHPWLPIPYLTLQFLHLFLIYLTTLLLNMICLSLDEI